MNSDKLTIKHILDQSINILKEAGIESFEHDAVYIISEILDLPKLAVYHQPDMPVSGECYRQILEIINKRAKHHPLQYLLHKAYFRDLSLTVGPGVLIPRPETELIIDILGEKIQPGSVICDIGTGSGAIILSIAQEFPETTNIGIDISPEALYYAVLNRQHHNLRNVSFMMADLLSACRENCFDIIIANLPYVSQLEYDQLDDVVRLHEPQSALLSGDDGLDDIRRLIAMADKYLRKEGVIILEIGYEQGNAVVNLFQQNKCFSNISLKKDLNLHDRFVLAVKLD